MLKGSWRTTGLGLLTIIGAIVAYIKAGLDNDLASSPDWATTAAAITAGWGLLMARDNKVSSEDAGVK